MASIFYAVTGCDWRSPLTDLHSNLAGIAVIFCQNDSVAFVCPRRVRRRQGERGRAWRAQAACVTSAALGALRVPRGPLPPACPPAPRIPVDAWGRWPQFARGRAHRLQMPSRGQCCRDFDTPHYISNGPSILNID